MATATASGDGAANAVAYITGATDTLLLWPELSIPSTFTICSVTRFTGGTRQRILKCSGYGLNWLHGHGGGDRGPVYYDAYMVADGNVGNVDDWLVMCGTNAGATFPGNIIVDQDEIGTADGGTGGGRLNINGPDAENSDWALHSVLIWDYSLGIVPRNSQALTRPWNSQMSRGNMTRCSTPQRLAAIERDCCIVVAGQSDW